MADKKSGGRGLRRSWREFAVSFVGYVVGFIAILLVLETIGMTRRQSQLAFGLALVVPLVPFLILLAYSGRIDTIRAPGGIEITFGEMDREPERDGTRSSPDRRTILKAGGIVAAIGTIWGAVSQWDGISGLLMAGDEATGDGDGDLPTLTPTAATPTETRTDTPTDPQTDTGTEPPAEDTASPEFETGGELVASIEADVEDFDPTERGSVVSSQVLAPVYEGLVATDFQGRPQPYLAESVDIEGDTNVTITLRDGITFHDHDAIDDRTVTAEDVLATFERYRDTTFESDVGEWYRFGSGTVVDERTLEVELTRKYAPFVFSIGVPIVPKEVAGGDVDLSRNPIGTGPYVFEEYESGRLVRLRKNERYWVGETDAFDDVSRNFPQEGALDTVTFRVVSGGSDQLAALRRGDIDLANEPPDSSIEGLEEDGSFTVAETTDGSFELLVYPMHEEAGTPFQHRKVRLGVNRLVPREAIVETVYDGVGRPAYAPVSPAVTQFTSEKLQEEIAESYARYDREAAQSLLEEGFAEAGFDAPFETTIVVNENPRREQMVDLVGQSMEDTGFFRVETDVLEFSTLVEKALTEDSHTKNQIVTLGWLAGWDPDGYVRELFHSEQATPNGVNINHYSDRDIDELIENGAKMYDFEKRADIYEQLQVDIARDSPAAFVRFGEDQSVHATHVQDWNEYPFDSGEYNGIYAPYAGTFTWVENGG